MPYYKDGSKARLGDLVKGVTYNLGGKEIVGKLVSITPGGELCNCVVAYLDAEPLDEGLEKIPYGAPGMVVKYSDVPILLQIRTDYGETRQMKKIGGDSHA